MKKKSKSDVKVITKFKYVRTQEDWHPSFDTTEKYQAHPLIKCLPKGKYIKISFFWDEKENKGHVAVWGADDEGMSFSSKDKAELNLIYDKIKDNITKEKLINLGFIRE